jgi:hypothetical protein
MADEQKMQGLTETIAKRSLRGARTTAVATVVVLAVAIGLAACGDSDTTEGTIPLSEWVDEFDQICLDVIAEVESATDLTDDEFDAMFDQFGTEVRALPEPDAMADTVADLVDAISSTISSDDENLDDAALEALDERVGAAMTSLGVSEACIRGAT